MLYITGTTIFYYQPTEFTEINKLQFLLFVLLLDEQDNIRTNELEKKQSL